MSFNLDLLEEILNKAVMVILEKAGFNSKIFQDYLVGRKTKYLCNTIYSSSINIDISVGQGSTLSSILYLSPIFYIFEKRIKKHYLKIQKAGVGMTFNLCTTSLQVTLVTYFR